MPPKKRLDRWKTGFKDFLGLNSPDKSSTSLPNTRQPSPSPAPPTLPRPATPQPGAAGPSAHIDSGSHLLSPPTVVFPFHASSPEIPNVLPNEGPGSQASQSAPAASLDPIQAEPSSEETNLERARSVAWAGLKTLIKVVDASTGIFPPFKEAVGGLNQFIDVFESASKGRKDYDELRTKLNMLLADLGTFFGDPASLTMTTSMKNLSIGINEELKLVQEKSGRGAVRRHVEALEDVSEIMECYHRIQGHLERLTLNANLNMWKIVDEQATEARLLRLLPTMSAVYNSAESEDVKRGPCTPGTRVEELAKLRGWVRDGAAGDVYWMNGMAGTGKTTIAYSLCEELEKTAELGASFFCSRLIPECRSVKLIIPAIAYQLARFSYPFQCALSRVLKADPDVHSRVLKAQFEKLLMSPLLEVKDALPSDLIVVIDALDECEGENSVAPILDMLLAQTASSHLPVRFLVSSRPEPEIYSRMMRHVGQDFKARLVLHDLDAETVKHDIQTYLQTELSDVHLTDSQLEALVERSGVLFIYASTAARYIKAGVPIEDHIRRLNMILGLSSPSMHKKHSDIDALYRSILNAAFENKDFDESNQKQMKTILDTVICAQEPMTVAALSGLLGFTSGKQVDAMLRPLGSVINIAETSGMVTTLHASFPDFMLHRNRSLTFYCDDKSNHARLATACFEVIEKNGPQFNICSLGSSYLQDDQVHDMTARVDRAVTPQLFYACRYWIAHLEFGDPFSNISGILYDFLSCRLLLWMEVLNVKQSIYLGPGIIERAENWIRAHRCPNEMSGLAHDAWCFVSMFASHPVSQSTPHLYVSMLPFWSDSMPIATHYKKQIKGTIKTQGTAMSRRQLALLTTWTFDAAVRSACFSPDGSLIAIAVSSSVCLMNGVTGQAVVGPLEHKGSVRSVAFSPDGTLIASGSEDGTIGVWSIQRKQAAVGPLTGHTDTVHSVSFSPDGTRIVSGSADATIRVWDVRSGLTVIGPLKGHTQWVYSVCFSPDGARIVSGSWDRTLRIWEAHGGKLLVGPLKGHSDINSVCFSADGTKIFSCADDGQIRAWSAQTGKMSAGPFEGHTNRVMSLGISPDDNYLVSGSYDKTIRVWNLNSNPVSARILEGHTGEVTSVTFSSDGSRIVSCSNDKTIRVWDARTRATVADSLEGHTGAVFSVGFSPDGKHIVSGSGDKTIRMWDAQSGQVVGGPLEGHTGSVRSVCFSPDGTRIASGSEDTTIRVWDVQRMQTAIGPLEGQGDWVRTICFSPDGALIASGSDDETIGVWDAQNGKPIGNPLEGHDDYVRSVCFSPDSTRIASGSDDRTIRVWDFRSGQTVVGPLKGHTGYVLCVCFSPNGTRIASSSSDKTVRAWDAQSGQPIFDPLESHTDAINSACFSPDGTLIVSGSDDKTVRLWDARSGKAVGDPLVGHAGPVYSVVFSPDGMHIVSGSYDQTIRVWDVRGLLRMYGVTDYLPSPAPAPISPPRPHESWVLRADGWVVDRQSQLLAWVPPDLHAALLYPRDPCLLSAKGSLQIDFESANLGESWAECYQPLSH